MASNNKLRILPKGFERLAQLEYLQLNDNHLTRLPEKLGSLLNLKKLHVHENRLDTLPREFSKLLNLVDFSIEWFMYTKPANSRTQKNPQVIKSVRDFCQNFKFLQSETDQKWQKIQDTQSLKNRRESDMSSLSFNQEEADTFDHGGYVSFVDFII